MHLFVHIISKFDFSRGCYIKKVGETEYRYTFACVMWTFRFSKSGACGGGFSPTAPTSPTESVSRETEYRIPLEICRPQTIL